MSHIRNRVRKLTEMAHAAIVNSSPAAGHVYSFAEFAAMLKDPIAKRNISAFKDKPDYSVNEAQEVIRKAIMHALANPEHGSGSASSRAVLDQALRGGVEEGFGILRRRASLGGVG